MLFATIMAGGSGTRFWPASRKQFPKQLLSLVGERSMLQSTVDRLDGLCDVSRILILTNEQLVKATREQLPSLPQTSLIGEPCKRDTAPCIGVAASIISKQDPEATMLVMPADHVISTDKQFHQAAASASSLVDEDPSRIVTFGIKPTYPAQVFGYIERAEQLEAAGCQAFAVKRFCEKPDEPTARQFVDSGNFYWNAGIFVWKAKTILAALQEFEPEMYERVHSIAQAFGTPDFEQAFRENFEKIQGKSIDFAVMEKYQNVCVIEAPYDWDDVGNWTSLPRLASSDEHGNTVIGKNLTIDTEDSIVRSTSQHLVVTLGIRNCIVVHTPDATLVADKRDESAVRKVVEKLEELGWTEYL